MLCEILQSAFRKSKYENIREWFDATNCPLSYFTMTSIINQGKEPSVPTFVVAAYLFGVPTADIAAACKAAGDTVFHRILTGVSHEQR